MVATRQAGDTEQEIEITPEMVREGALALEGTGYFEDRVMMQSDFDRLAKEIIRPVLARAILDGVLKPDR